MSSSCALTVYTNVRLLLGSRCLLLYLNLSILFVNYLEQMTEADDIFRCILSALKGLEHQMHCFKCNLSS